jgi:hypothetical protein
MKKNYLHEIIVFPWVLISFLLALPNIPITPAIIWSAYILVTVWFLRAWRRKDEINLRVKIVASIGMMLYFLLSFGSLCGVITLLKLPKETPKYLIVGNVLSNHFVIVLISALIISPLIVSIFHKYYMYIALLIATPALGIGPYINFTTINKSSLTIGIHSTEVLAVITATYLSSYILHRFFESGKSNNGADSDAANTAAQVTP